VAGKRSRTVAVGRPARTDDGAGHTIGATMTAVEEAARAGIDLSLIEVSLSYTYDKRAEQHQAALELALELERIGRELRGAAEPTVLDPESNRIEITA
jgi:hypothetical protein